MLTQITQSIYISDFDSSNDRPRLGYIKGSRYNVMIDSGNSPAHFNDFIQECTKIGLPLPDFILLTHWHWDHVYGLSATKIPTICSQLTQDKLIEMSHWKWDDESMRKRLETGEDIEFCDQNIRIEYTNPQTIQVRLADITFEDKRVIHLGDKECILQHIDNDHASDSIIIYVPEEKVIFLGDIISPDYHHGDMHYTSKKYNDLKESLFKYDFEYAIHGHTEVFNRDSLNQFFLEPECQIKESNDDDSLFLFTHLINNRF